jgi:hypothetical protein
LKKKTELKIGRVEAKITSDFIIDLYDKAQDLEGDEKKAMLATIAVLREHIGELLVSDQQDIDTMT